MFLIEFSIQWASFPYTDKAQEAKRLAAAESTKAVNVRRDSEQADKKQKNSAWSEKVKRQEEREKRREKKKLKAKRLKSQELSAAVSSADNHLKREASEMDADDNEDDWTKEEKLAKRVKKGVVSQEEFDIEFGDL